MSFTHHSISVHYAKALIAAASRRGIDAQQLLRHAELNLNMVGKHTLRITPFQLSALMQHTWAALDDEFLGMSCDKSRFGVFAMMARQAAHQKTLRSVYYFSSRFYELITEAVQIRFTVNHEEARLSVMLPDTSSDPDGMLRELLLLVWHRFPACLIGKPIALTHVGLEFSKPSHHLEHKLMFPCEIRYKQAENYLAFKASNLSNPVVQTTGNLKRYLRRAPLDWFQRQAYDSVFTRRVREFLENEAYLNQTDMEKIASRLHVTSRTLRRKLGEEGTSFQQLKNEVRRDTAIQYLSLPKAPISKISQRLGFSEPAAFSRAFKQWTGVSPSAYRFQG